MISNLLITTEELSTHLGDPNWLIADCRFALTSPELKSDQYRQAHIPGAVYFHLGRDLSAPVIAGVTGRHPLPSAEEAARRLGELGIGPATRVVAYDDQGGALAAARLWWLLRWLGYDTARLLDGGWQKWLEEDRPVRGGVETRPAQELSAHPRNDLWVTTDEIKRYRHDRDYRIIDVRTPERYRGEKEPIDPVAGHIPGAVNAPYTGNLTAEGQLRPAPELRAIYRNILGDVPPERVVFYCGSGVTAVHSLLAVELAGLGQARVYAGSWSEWIADHHRPVAVGDELNQS